MTEPPPPARPSDLGRPGGGESAAPSDRRAGSLHRLDRDEASRRRRRRVVLAAGTVVAATIAVAGGVVATRGDETTTSPTSSAVGPTTTVPPSTTAVPTTAAAGPLLEDGRHAAYLKLIDVANRTVEFDVIQFLTGAEATAAYHADFPDETGPPDDDYYIVNDNPRLRALPVAHDVDVVVVITPAGGYTEPHRVTFEELAGLPVYDPFWLTVSHDTVVRIEEQFVP